MKKFIIFPILGALLILFAVIKIIRRNRPDSPKAQTPVVMALNAECVIARDTLPVHRFTAVGNIRANERVELVSELALRLVSIHFNEGSRVSKGDRLFQLDDAALKADLQKVEARLELAQRTAGRNQDLFETGGISQQIYDESVFAVKVLQAEKESLLVLLDKTSIDAPFSGIVGIRNVSEGAYVTPGKVLTTLEDVRRLKIEFSVPEAYAGLIFKGKSFDFTLDGLPGTFSAVVDAVNPSIDPLTGNLRALAIIVSVDSRLKAGTALSMKIDARALVPALYVPTQALIPTPGGNHAYVLKNGRADYRNVRTGIRTESLVEIREGIQPGDSVLVTGFMKVRPNVPVNITKVW
ncbi:MAG TPA: efflux RND transporter periplasmic adaptor subunit [Prolixibacteraceae bacterium]|nr:efflux RND transporter periplasmic adaptor subunit [Prolixibacteraceae bacterium]